MTDRFEGNGSPDDGTVVRLRLDPASEDAEGRVARWREVMAPTAELELSAKEAAALRCAMTACRLSSLVVARIECSDQRLVRSRAMANSLPIDHVLVNAVESGCVFGRFGRRRAVLEPGSLIVHRLSSPMDVRMEATV